MSTYYYYVNKTKHEYFSSGDMGYGLKKYVYRQELLPLIGYLQINHMYVRHMHNEPCRGHIPEGNEDFPLEGHWAMDDCQLVDEYNKDYGDICNYELYGTEYGAQKWVNISKQLFEEYNSYIKYWNNPDDVSEEYKEGYRKSIEKMCIPIGPLGAHFD